MLVGGGEAAGTLQDVSLTGAGLRVEAAVCTSGDAVVVAGELADGLGAVVAWRLRGHVVWVVRQGDASLVGVRFEPGQRLTVARVVQWVRRTREGGAFDGPA